MFYYIKKVFKTILIILVILALCGIGYRYNQLKKEGKLEKIFAINKSPDYYKSEYSSNVQENIKEENIEESNAEETNVQSSSNSEESTFVIEEKDYDGYYYTFNFDNRLLLYEGIQSSKATGEALDVLISDVDDLMYSKPTIEFINFAGLSSTEITSNDLVEYKNVLNQAKKSLGNGSYTFSFEYGVLNAKVNKIIITKN